MSSNFEIEIVRQGWINPELEDAPSDLCSHGDIRLEIGGRVIVSGDAEPGEVADWWTISTSALALLRTLEADHSGTEQLVLCCGMLMMLSCPIGVYWSVTHVGDRVQLGDVVRRDTLDASEDVHFPGLAVELPESAYRLPVVAFAEKAKEPFVAAEQTPGDDYEQQLYEEFWREYDERLRRALSPLAE